jgi:rare lipoprotein A
MRQSFSIAWQFETNPVRWIGSRIATIRWDEVGRWVAALGVSVALWGELSGCGAATPKVVGVGSGEVEGCAKGELKRAPQRVFQGLASYYSDALAGHKTANGERYSPSRLSAAHRSLPFGTRLRVTRADLRNSPVLCVTVNDRGPYHGRRVLDLSRRAARHLDMVRAGVVPVRAEVLGSSR